ncbi:hypothetical protein [Yinghuangia soli]|uniref:Integral membrane protein n=1 Tax=Yinghuangia soli TaxID=2908204 RepID=A0AA41Q991_9ACTN|nr:hypothetical protein [Yinghuangia soli]MCF2533943.1 hypothetical protein [Yinghuangia soli]
MVTERYASGVSATLIAEGRLPLTLAFAAFLATFLITRLVTRMIRAGRGPFRNVSAGGTHIHHVVPGIILTMVGGFLAVAAGAHTVSRCIAAVLFGIGAGLVLDEFAMIVHLDDVYWSEQGRASVEVTVLAAAAVGLAITGFVPFDATGPDGTGPADYAFWAVWTLIIVGVSAITFAKGKFRLGVIGILVLPVSLTGAIRLARPNSPWARRFYRGKPRKQQRAAVRAQRHDARWAPLRRRFGDLVAGAPAEAPAPEPSTWRTRRPSHAGGAHRLRRTKAAPQGS